MRQQNAQRGKREERGRRAEKTKWGATLRAHRGQTSKDEQQQARQARRPHPSKAPDPARLKNRAGGDFHPHPSTFYRFRPFRRSWRLLARPGTYPARPPTPARRPRNGAGAFAESVIHRKKREKPPPEKQKKPRLNMAFLLGQIKTNSFSKFRQINFKKSFSIF